MTRAPSLARTWRGAPTEIMTIYERPDEYPQSFVVRRWYLSGAVATGEEDPVTVALTLHGARNAIPSGMTRTFRSLDDDPAIVETWM